MDKSKCLVDVDRYRIEPGTRVDLTKRPTACDVKIDRAKVEKELFPKVILKLQDYQEKLFAQNTYGLILALQAMDAAGKDGTVKHVFGPLNPAGVKVVSFKQPTSLEKDHDYLWRFNVNLPSRGEIGIFNRSQYEDVVTVRIHQLLKDSGLPPELVNEDIWKQRYADIAAWEKHLAHNGFPMVKIFLHVSRTEQQRRLAERILRDDKNWKFSMSDLTERLYWNDYQKDYAEAIEATSTKEAPWYIVPADDKWYTRYVVSLITLEALEAINPRFPEPNEETKKNIEQMKKLLELAAESDSTDLAKLKAHFGKAI
ncbi:polyphosphate kinase 2 family protein [Mesosutterella sp. AGMB02718]|uniref:Polyphosphate kinase 2 family protein n=1 Tax=Mesosutterella faecium TaxID=2925194 RepID=A0ABT7IP13_9BURK|nr:PPK2 family polyphosphate kinase [Mesosutterella sp. AGMB02718]MDL2060133.1 polyphosphate kinase 2 family protein [Mesosutterella sp. AGMB02718]